MKLTEKQKICPYCHETADECESVYWFVGDKNNA